MDEIWDWHLRFNRLRIPHRAATGERDDYWIRVGMPRIERSLIRSTFYLFGMHPGSAACIGPGGTGFIVARPSRRLTGMRHYYGVTAHHVIKKHFYQPRINQVSGLPARYIDVEPHEWTIRPAFDDVAVIDLTDRLDVNMDDVTAIPEELFSRIGDFDDKVTGLGDDVFMVGLFANEAGQEFNNPKIRFGNLSAIADDRAPIEQGNRIKRPSHIIDMHSRTGFSGSPVFSYRPPFGYWIDEPWSLAVDGSVPKPVCFRFLGLHSAQYPEVIHVGKAPKKGQSIGDPIVEGDKLWIPSSMTIVIPAWRISELLDEPELEQQREDRDEKRLPEWEQSPRPEFIDPMPEAVTWGEEETGAERFSRTVRKLLDTPPQPRADAKRRRREGGRRTALKTDDPSSE